MASGVANRGAALRAARSGAPSDGTHIPCISPRILPDRQLRREWAELLSAAQLTNHGPHALALEAELGQWLDSPVALVSSGSAALELGLLALDLTHPTRRKALLPACTYLATLNAVQRVGLDPVFVDIDPATWTVSPAAVETALAAHRDVAVVLAVNVYGVPPALGRIREVAAAAGVPLLYDNAHGLGTTIAARRQPADADVTTWSMHATKLLPAAEGGFVTAAEPATVARVRQMRNHGLAADPVQAVVGTNAKLSEVHAVLARSGLRQLPRILSQRRANYAWLERALLAAADGRVTLQASTPDGVSNAQNLTVLVVDDDGAPAPTLALRWIAALAAEGVEARRYFWPPLHTLARTAAWAAPLPITEAIMPALVCLPLHTHMPAPTLRRLQRAFHTTLAGLH